MNRFRNYVIVAAPFSVLAIIGSIVNSHQAVAQGPPNGLAVNIVNPLPMPVTGSLGISGTPNVHVTNSATAPVLFLNVNDSGRIPYQKHVLAPGSFVDFPAVPSGHRLVIQHVSMKALLSGSATNAYAQISGRQGVNSLPPVGYVPMTLQPVSTGVAEAIANQPILAYFEADQIPLISVFAFPVSSISNAQAVLTGYMLDCTIAPCAPIAP